MVKGRKWQHETRKFHRGEGGKNIQQQQLTGDGSHTKKGERMRKKKKYGVVCGMLR